MGAMMIRLLSLCLLIMSTILSLSCGKWKVDTHRSGKIADIPFGEAPGSIAVIRNPSGFIDITFLVRLSRGKILAADNLLKRVQVLDRGGSPELVIGSQKSAGKPGAGQRIAPFSFSIIGEMVLDSEGNLYVQNRFSSAQARRKSSIDDLNITPSYVLVFDRKGALKYTLGQTGESDIPFYYIESIDVDTKDRLLVVSRSLNTWSVSRYTGKRRDSYANLGKLDFTEKEKEGTFTGKIELVRTMHNGEGAVISVAYYHQSRFKYRKIFTYAIDQEKIVRTALSTPDPKNELFSIIDSRYLYLWNVENKKIKFMVCNLDGGIVNNILLKMPDDFDSFGEILIDESGLFYSISARKDRITVIEWK